MQTDAHARLMVTRGVKHRPFQHPALSRSGPTMVIIMEHSRPKIPRPIRLATVPHLRGLPMTQDPKLNSHSKLNCILACIAAEKAGADEALMLDVHGFVNTTNACNFFIVRKGEVWTSTGDYCMPGITRAKVIASAARTASRSSRRTSRSSRPTRPTRPSSPAPSARRRRWA
jgi:branched-chain amino acid aminotransferase